MPTSRGEVSFKAKIPAQNNPALSTGYAYDDNDVDIFGKALKENNDISYFSTDFQGAMVGTQIFSHNDHLFLELPAISSIDTSPPGLMIKAQLANLESLNNGPGDADFKKEYPNPGDTYPITIVAPYKLESWHWNTLEVTLNGPDEPATCKRYDTDGRSHPVEEAVFNDIRESLGNEHCSGINNQQGSKIEYQNQDGTARSLQKNVNCGLASAIILQDIINGTMDYGGGKDKLSDQVLRQYAVNQVTKNPDLSRNFGKADNGVAPRRSEPVTIDTHDYNPFTALETREESNQISSQISEEKPTSQQFKILYQCQGELDKDNTVDALKILRDNKKELGNIYSLIFKDDDTTQDFAIDAIQNLKIEIDLGRQEEATSPSTMDGSATVDAAIGTEESNQDAQEILNSAMSTLRRHVAEYPGDVGGPDTADLIEALHNSIDLDGSEISHQAQEVFSTHSTELLTGYYADVELAVKLSAGLESPESLKQVAEPDLNSPEEFQETNLDEKSIDHLFSEAIETLEGFIKSFNEQQLLDAKENGLVNELSSLITANDDAKGLFESMANEAIAAKEEELGLSSEASPTTTHSLSSPTSPAKTTSPSTPTSEAPNRKPGPSPVDPKGQNVIKTMTIQGITNDQSQI